VTWDGRDEAGVTTRRGMYFMQVRIGSEALRMRVTFVN